MPERALARRMWMLRALQRVKQVIAKGEASHRAHVAHTCARAKDLNRTSRAGHHA